MITEIEPKVAEIVDENKEGKVEKEETKEETKAEAVIDERTKFVPDYTKFNL